ncbi:MAG TPA: glycoside hydrolase family 3 N-terminal domain-containing protein, partial [Candidatus Saccharimonadales bacterium]|nr:glycoside hydrolase family 3 N-terminal domain-containing protein [Candidatus Saccharimonadales bacterium]
LAFAEGLQAAGVVPVVKHFPGLGGTKGNTDFRMAHTLPWDQLQKTGMLPFKAAIEAGLPAIMVANAAVPGLTDQPATLSPQVMEVLRQQLQFKGLIVTDTLSAEALAVSGYSVEQAAVLALRAGADLLLYGNADTPVERFTQITTAIVTAVNQKQLSRERLIGAVNAVLAAKHLGSCGS